MREPLNYLPAPELGEFIASYGILEFPDGVDEPYASPPIALSGFIIHTLNTRNVIIAKIEDKDHFTHHAVATGQVTFPVYGRNVGHARLLLIFFQPLGMHQLFGTNMASLTNTSIKLEEFLGTREAKELLDNLKFKQDNSRQVQILNSFFCKRIPLQNDTIERFKKILNYIHEKKGSVCINEIEDISHYSRKTLERHFKKLIGLSPKVYCQIYQFRCLMNMIRNYPHNTWAQVANDAGYYDQSHMSRYLKEYLKVSPNALEKQDTKFVNYLLSR